MEYLCINLPGPLTGTFFRVFANFNVDMEMALIKENFHAHKLYKHFTMLRSLKFLESNYNSKLAGSGVSGLS